MTAGRRRATGNRSQGFYSTVAYRSRTALVDSLVVFPVSLLIGALGIYLGARSVTGRGDYTHAIVTALVGAIVWAVVASSGDGSPSSARCWPSWRTSG